uniref:Alpha/beta-hydrolase n=1 Tax=Psilocybe cubensis TaxID=181762 RepID=A0A8H7XK85_PSICU
MAPKGQWFKLSVVAICSIVGLGFFLHLPNTKVSYHQLQSGCDSLQSIGAWEWIAPNKDLVWEECAPGRECARLIVPLDYANPNNEKAVIALVRKPAVVPRDSEKYRGPILFNPGGPGGSGVDLIMGKTADLLATIVGPEFDLVSFDPRGIASYTTLPLVNNSDEGIHRTLARAKLVGQLAAESDNGYLRHMNTDYTARDMLQIVEAYGRSKLQYWGFSYGTILGATFAAMFPDKIERMVIDGVADAEDYYALDRHLTSLIDTDKILDGFFTECAEAGPENCHFWAPTADDIRRNLTVIFESIRSRPIPVKTDTTYGVLDYRKLKETIFTTLYKPYTLFPSLATALADLSAGNASALYTLIPGPKSPDCQCSPESSPFNSSVTDATTGILCNDGEEILEDVVALENHLNNLMKMSFWGDVWAGLRLNCLGWPKFPKTQFRGPFEGKTSHPILLIGNTADPVTPLWAARNMSRGFEGSVVLQQNSLGHCSLAAPSPCTQQYVRKYFIDGTLPPAGTVCEPIRGIFSVPDLSSITVEADEEQMILKNASSDLHDPAFLQAVIDLSGIEIVSGPL